MPYYYDSSDEQEDEPQNTDEELDIIYSNIDTMIAYVAREYLNHGIYKQLENYIVRKICQCNYEIVNTPGYKLRVGDNVKVYNEKDSMSKRREIIQPGEYVVDKVVNGLCRIRNIKNNKIQLVPRYKLARA